MQQLNTNKQTTKSELVHRQRLYLPVFSGKKLQTEGRSNREVQLLRRIPVSHWKLDRQITYDWQISSNFLFQATDIEGQEKQAEMSLFVYIDFRYRLYHCMRCFL